MDDNFHSSKASFELLMQLLEIGHEIEFTYKDKEYFIGNFRDGMSLILDSEELFRYKDDNYKFVEMAKIDGITLKELFANHSDEIEFGTIF